jgi:hypothetical protein
MEYHPPVMVAWKVGRRILSLNPEAMRTIHTKATCAYCSSSSSSSSTGCLVYVDKSFPTATELVWWLWGRPDCMYYLNI